MAFTNRHKALIYELLGIPRTGDGVIVSGILHRPPTMSTSYATWRESDHSTIVTKLDAAIAAVEALSDNGTENRIKSHLEEYDEIASSGTLVKKSPTGEGVLADDQEKVKRLKDLVTNNLGFSMPRGSFADDAKKAYGPNAIGMLGGGGQGDR